MKTNRMAAATGLALGTAAISGVSNFLNKIGVTAVKDPIVYTTLKNAIVAIGLIGIIIAVKQWREIIRLTKNQWFKLVAIGVIGGSLPFALFFTGLTQTKAINAALIHKTLFLWVLLLAIPLLRERMSRLQWLGVAAIFSANVLVGGFTGFSFNAGERMILAATILWAVENVIAKIALRDLSSLTVAAARMVIGSIVLGAFVAWRGSPTTITTLTATQWAWVGLTSLLLLGYVLTWYAALKRAPATYVATLLVPATLVTNVLSAVFVTHTFPLLQLVATILFITGASLVIKFAKTSAAISPLPHQQKI